MKRKFSETVRRLRQKKSGLKMIGIISIMIVCLLLIAYISVSIFTSILEHKQYEEGYISNIIAAVPLNYTEVMNIDVENATYVLKNYNYSLEDLTEELQSYYDDIDNCDLQLDIVLSPTYDEFFGIEITACKNNTDEWAYLTAAEWGYFPGVSPRENKKMDQRRGKFCCRNIKHNCRLE